MDSPKLEKIETTPSQDEHITLDMIQTILAKCNKDGSMLDSFSVKPGTKPGDNFMSLLLSVEIKLKNEEANITILIKITPSKFIKEGKMYDSYFPEVIKFQEEEKRLREPNVFNCWPNCLTSFVHGDNEYLIMEDLRCNGYKMGDRFTGLSTPQIYLVLLNLAKFHALSYSKFAGSWSKIIFTYPWLQDKVLPNWILQKEILSEELKILKNVGLSREADLIVDLCHDDYFWGHEMMEFVGGIWVENAVINHGDCWTNNILFKYDDDDDDKSTSGVKLLDYQLPRVAQRSPDLAYFLHTSLAPEVLNDGEELFCKYYYEEFIRFLLTLRGKQDVEGDESLSLDDFMQEYQKCKIFGVVMGLAITPVVCTEGGATPDWGGLKQVQVQNFPHCRSTNEISVRKIINLAQYQSTPLLSNK